MDSQRRILHRIEIDKIAARVKTLDYRDVSGEGYAGPLMLRGHPVANVQHQGGASIPTKMHQIDTASLFICGGAFVGSRTMWCSGRWAAIRSASAHDKAPPAPPEGTAGGHVAAPMGRDSGSLRLIPEFRRCVRRCLTSMCAPSRRFSPAARDRQAVQTFAENGQCSRLEFEARRPSSDWPMRHPGRTGAPEPWRHSSKI